MGDKLQNNRMNHTLGTVSNSTEDMYALTRGEQEH